MTTYKYTGSLIIIECPDCHMDFGITPRFRTDRRGDRKSFYCPAGHRQWFPGDTTEKQLEAARARNTHLEDQLRSSVEEAERTRHQLLRDRRRFANGVCPCCNRSFANVRRHMATQHPDYDVTHVDGAVEFPCTCGRTFETLRGLRTHQGHRRHGNWWKPGAAAHTAHLTRV